MREWVAKALEHADMTQAELSRELAKNYGWSDNRTILNKVLTGNRQLEAQEMFDISNATGYPVPAEGAPSEDAVGLRRVVVAGHVQAGVFSETWEWEEDRQYPVFIPDIPVLRGYRLYAAELLGPSMNRRYPEGTVVVFTNVQETGERPVPGKRYVIERTRITGEREHTIKLLHADNEGKLWLMPESDDPRFQAAISVEEGTNDGDEVVIIGRVRFAVTPE